jgi:hypothetical protein
MGVCEPGQGGNAAAINNTFMCLGEPPRLSLAPAPTRRRAGDLRAQVPGDAARMDGVARGESNRVVSSGMIRLVSRLDGARPSALTSRVQ